MDASPAMTLVQSCYCKLSAAVSRCDDRASRAAIDMLLDQHVPVLKIKEVILQNYLFAGFPAAIEGLIVLRDVCRTRNVPDQNYDEARMPEEILRDGEALCQKIYGKNFDKLMENMMAMSSDLHRWMITEGYGKVLSRPILDPIARELCVVASLTAMCRERQLISHIKGALHVGATPVQVGEAVALGNFADNQAFVQKTMVLLESMVGPR